jgi:transcriptional regulator with XRE-family HTH domain
MSSFGDRLRKLRTGRGLVIDQLVARTGLSRPYISQIETGKASPSLQSIRKLAAALDIPVTQFFVQETVPPVVVRKADRLVVSFGPPVPPNKQPRSMTLLSAPSRNMEMVILELPAGYRASDPDQGHDGEECFLVLKGKLRAKHGDYSFEVSEGDSFHWDGTVPHDVYNIGKDTARVLVSRTPPGFMKTRLAGDKPEPARKRRAPARKKAASPG